MDFAPLAAALSRRRFIAGTAAAILGAGTSAKADTSYRLGLSQPLDSPNYLRLKEMADHVRAESNGRMVFGQEKKPRPPRL